MEHLLETLNEFWKTFEATQEDETNGRRWFGNEAYYSDLGKELGI